MKKYMVFVIIAYNQESDDKPTDSVEIQLMDESVGKAMSRAKKLCERQFYYLKAILENYVKN